MAGPVASSTTATIGSARTNYARIGHAAQQVLPKILQNILAINEPPGRLHSDVSSNMFLLRNLRADEWSMINNGRIHGYSNFDMPLIYKLVRNLNLVTPPTRGWDYRVDPTPSEIAPGDDIERIRRVRNKMLHRGNANVSNTELTDFFVLFKDIARRLEQFLGKPKDEFVKTITDLENCSIDENIEKMYLDRLDKLKKKEEDLSKVVEKLQKDVDSLKNDDFNDSTIEEWQEQNKYFVRTVAVDVIFESLQTNHTFCVTGSSGIGKSASIHHIALCLRDTLRYQIRPCYDPSDISKNYKKENVQVFVFDDVCGKYTLLQRDVEKWIKMTESIQRVIASGNIKILATCRSQVFRELQFQRIKLFTEQSCDLSSIAFSLTNDMKLQIAKQYLPENVVDCIKNDLGTYEFLPLMFAIYKTVSKTSDIADAKSFFNNPFDKYTDEMNELKEAEDKTKFCSLFFVIINNGFVDATVFTAKESSEVREKREVLFDACGIPQNTVRKRVLEQLDSFIGLFLKKTIESHSGIVYTTIHDKTFDFLCFYYGTHLQEPFIEYADSKVISQRTQLKSINKSVDEFTIVIAQENEGEYLKRIIIDLSLGEVGDVFYNGQMKYEEFRSKLITSMKIHFDKDKMKEMLCLCDNDKSLQVEFTFMDDGCFGSLKLTPLPLCFKLGYTDIIEFILALIDEFDSEKFVLLLRKAIHSGYKTVGSMLLNRGVGIDDIDEIGWTPLTTACEAGQEDVVELLITRGSQVDCIDSHGWTPLMRACSKGHNKVVDMLISHGAIVNQRLKCQDTPLSLAIESKNANIVQSLFDHGYIIPRKPKINYLNLACKQADPLIVELLIRNGVSANEKDVFGISPLFAALKSSVSGNSLSKRNENQYEKVRILLDNEAIVNIIDENGSTPLELACKQKNISLIKLLIDNGADVNLRNSFGFSPLAVICNSSGDLTSEDCTIVEILLEHGSNVHVPDVFRRTVFSSAFIQCKDKLISLIIEKGVNVNLNVSFMSVEFGYVSPLLWACRKSQYTLANLLLDYDENVNICNKYRETLLTILCKEINRTVTLPTIGNDSNGVRQNILTSCDNTNDENICSKYRIVTKLLEKGANVNTSDEYGHSPLTNACLQSDIGLVRLLIERGADVNHEIIYAESAPLSAACDHDSNELSQDKLSIVELLLDKGANVNTPDKDGNSPLTNACLRSDIGLVRLLIERGADVNHSYDSYFRTPLSAACGYDSNESSQDKLSIVELLLDKEANVNTPDKDGHSLLTQACLRSDIGLVRLLIERGADVNHESIYCESTPLSAACDSNELSQDKLSIVELLLDKEANVNTPGKDGNSPLTNACLRSDIGLVRLLIERGADVNHSSDGFDYNPLSAACKWHNDERSSDKYKIVKLLLKKGANIDTVDEVSDSLLTIACQWNDISLVRLLLERGADVNQDSLIAACDFESNEVQDKYKIVELLLDQGADLNNVDEDGYSPLINACLKRGFGLISLLIGRGADVNPYSVNHRVSPLATACVCYSNELARDQYKSVELLLDKGANVNAVDEDGYSPLTRACNHNNLNLVSLLFERGANVNPDTGDDVCRTPLSTACACYINEMSPEKYKIVKLLLDKGAYVNTVDGYGDLPLTIACYRCNLSLVSLLLERGAGVNTDTNNICSTPLSAACHCDNNKLYQDQYKIVELLLDKGANINAVDEYKTSPLTIACSHSNLSLVSLLLERGADVNPDTDDLVHSPLGAACSNYIRYDSRSFLSDPSRCHSFIEIITILLESGANINAVDRFGKTSFSMAYNSCNLKLINFLIEMGAIVRSDYSSVLNTFLRENNVIRFNDLNPSQTEAFQCRLNEEVKKSSSEQNKEDGYFGPLDTQTRRKRKCDEDLACETIAKKKEKTVELSMKFQPFN